METWNLDVGQIYKVRLNDSRTFAAMFVGRINKKYVFVSRSGNQSAHAEDEIVFVKPVVR